MLKLEWLNPNKDGTIRSAEMPFGHYTVFSDGEWWGPQVGDNIGKAGSVAVAKLVCQADLEDRTRRIAQGMDNRSMAVEIVDAIHGYTMEFSSTPASHEAKYDRVERMLNGRKD